MQCYLWKINILCVAQNLFLWKLVFDGREANIFFGNKCLLLVLTSVYCIPGMAFAVCHSAICHMPYDDRSIMNVSIIETFEASHGQDLYAYLREGGKGTKTSTYFATCESASGWLGSFENVSILFTNNV